jgi:hypothetical protein
VNAHARGESFAARPAEASPGRVCPTAYRYSPRDFARAPEIVADTIYVVGGLYGNIEALEALRAMAAREPGPVVLVFNGDFHWFDVAREDFESITRAVLASFAIRGNVETEIAAEDSGAGCGCAYPMDVSDAEVARSNRILERLRATASAFPDERARLGQLPMNLVAAVGETRVGIVHGDAASLAGWGFAPDRLDDPRHARWIASMFGESEVDVFASTHTCLPALRSFEIAGERRGIANNGAAGMPNFEAKRYGLITRIGRAPFAGGEKLHGMRIRDAHVEALRVEYDHPGWTARFLASWPEGSPAHQSYFGRITRGPRFAVERAAPRAA